MISLIFFSEIINVVVPEPIIFWWIPASVADAATVNTNGIKTLSAKGLSTFPVKGNPVFIKDPKRLPKSNPDFPILCNCFFDNFILAVEPFAKASRRFGTCPLVKDNLCGKLVSSLESMTIFDEIFKVTSVLFFIQNFNLISGG